MLDMRSRLPLKMFIQLLLFFLLQLSSLVLGQISCSTAGSTRITTSSTSTSPSSSSNGRVEYCFNAGSGNRWTPICLESWNLNAAHVACRSTSSSTSARSSAVNTVPGNGYDSGVATTLLTLTCTGLESNLSQCNPRQVSTQNEDCNGRQTAGVTCRTSPSTNSIVLVGGGSDLNGFVQIYDGSQWLFLSTSSEYWTTHHAQVACNQLGYVGGTVPDLGAEPAGMSGPFTLVCPSNARGLPDCIDDATVFPTNTFLATLSCSANGQSDFALRLVRSTRSNAADSGVLEVSYQGRYGTICSSGWSSTEATVACKNLGFLRSTTRTSSSESVFDSKPSWIGGIDCSSSDLTSISSCTRDTILGESCSSDAHVTCDSSIGEFPEAAITGIVVPGVLILIAIVLIVIQHKPIKAKFLVYKRQHCPTWDLNCGCVRSRMARVNPNRRQQSGRPPVTLATSSETNRTERLVVTPVVATATNQTSVRRDSSSSSSSSDSEVERSNSRQQQQRQQQQQQQQRQEPHNPEFSSGAPPSYNVAGTFAQVDELGEKPPPYIPPVPVEPTAPAAPPPQTNFGGYPLPTGPPAAPPMFDSAYPPPPSSNAAYPPPPSSNAAYPPPPSSNAAYPPPSFPNYN